MNNKNEIPKGEQPQDANKVLSQENIAAIKAAVKKACEDAGTPVYSVCIAIQRSESDTHPSTQTDALMGGTYDTSDKLKALPAENKKAVAAMTFGLGEILDRKADAAKRAASALLRLAEQEKSPAAASN